VCVLKKKDTDLSQRPWSNFRGV